MSFWEEQKCGNDPLPYFREKDRLRDEKNLLDFLGVLRQIEAGEVNLEYDTGPRGYDEYFKAGRWKFSIFDDDSTWDGLTSVTTPDGIKYYDDEKATFRLEGPVVHYEPSERTWQGVYLPLILDRCMENIKQATRVRGN